MTDEAAVKAAKSVFLGVFALSRPRADGQSQYARDGSGVPERGSQVDERRAQGLESRGDDRINGNIAPASHEIAPLTRTASRSNQQLGSGNGAHEARDGSGAYNEVSWECLESKQYRVLTCKPAGVWRRQRRRS